MSLHVLALRCFGVVCAASLLVSQGCGGSSSAAGDAGPAGSSVVDNDQPGEAGADEDAMGGEQAAGDDAAVLADDAGPGEAPLPQEEPLTPVWGTAALPDLDPTPGVVEVELVAQRTPLFIAEVPLEMWTFGDTIPGPLIQAMRGDRVIVHFTNDLPEETTVQWHGLRISNEMDGTPRVQDPIQPGETFTYDFVVPDAGSYWYHPHVRANEQVERGLYGVLVVRDEDEPVFDLERYFVLDDILLTDTGLPPFLSNHMEVMHGRSGNVLLTNGSAELVTGEAEVGQVERWRLVNTANARTMSLSVQGATWRVVGTDGGLLPEPFETERLTLPVGARYDVEVTYTTEGAASLVSHVLTVDESQQLVELAIPVARVSVADTGLAPTTVTYPTMTLPDREPTEYFQMLFDAADVPGVGLQWTINGQAMAMEPIANFALGATVLIQIGNQAGPEHPFHLHGQFFEIVRRNAQLVDEPGLRDTVLVPGLETVQIRAYFDNPGRWMAHCHILEHAELGMMAEITVDDALEGSGAED